MSIESFRKYDRRTRTSAGDQNRLRRQVENLSRGGPVRGGGLSSAGRAGSQILSASPAAESILVRVDGPLASYNRLEAFTQVQDDGAGGWVEAADGVLGSAGFPGWLPDGWPAPAEGDVVLALPSFGEDGLVLLTPAGPTEGTEDAPVEKPYGPYLTTVVTGPNVGMTISPGTVYIVSGGGSYAYSVPVCFNYFVCWGSQAATLAGSTTYDFGWSYKPWLVLATPDSSACTIHGLLAPSGSCDGCEVLVTNTGPGTVGLLDASDAANGAVAANRIFTIDGSTLTLDVNDSALLRYDRGASRWRLIYPLPPPPAGGTVAFSGARVYHNADQTFGGSSGVLAFNSERYDTDSYHDPATNNTRLTVPASGYYQIGGCVTFEVNGSGVDQLFVRVYLNGATSLVYAVAFTPATGLTVAVTLNVNTTYQLASGDYVELTVQLIHYSGTDGLKVLSIGNYTPDFWITKLGD